jgi:protoporphyrinogen/coproporphyrinogen III oxidase
MEQKYGNMIRGFVAQRRMVEEMRKKYPPDPKNPRTFFTSFKKGMNQLTDAMADAAGRDRMHTGVTVRSIGRSDDGIWTVNLSDGQSVTGDAVIVATEAWAAASIVRPVDGQIADAVGAIESTSSGTCSFAFREEDITIDMNVFGVLCPAVEKRSMLAATYSSTKWPGRAPKGAVMFRGFVGGPHNQKIMEKSDEEIEQIVLADMREILGIGPKAQPVFSRFYRWTRGMPQYTLGHLDRVELVEARSKEISGFALAGGSYRGVGLPNCIESGEVAVTKVLGDMGIALAEDQVEEKRVY